MGTKEYHKEYYQNNKDKLKIYGKGWRDKNPDYHKEHKKEYRQRPEVKAREKEHYQKNKEKIKEYGKEWYENNKEEVKKYRQSPKGKAKIKDYHKNYYKNNKEKLKEYSREYMKEYYIKNTKSILELNKKYRQRSKGKAKIKEYGQRSKAKARTNYLKKTYNLSLKDYNKLLLKQKGVCAICGCEPNGQNLAVDHNHQTGKIRELLCKNCNTTIGNLKEDISLFYKCIEYLKQHKSK